MRRNLLGKLLGIEEFFTGVGAADSMGGKIGLMPVIPLKEHWGENTGSDVSNILLVQRAEEKLTSRSSINGGRQSEEYESNE